MSRTNELHKDWMSDPAYRTEYDALESGSALAAAMIRARAETRLTQQQLPERMGAKQEVARWEGGKVMPSARTLERLARATGMKLRISFAPSSNAVRT